jgi:hypothetical protein
VGFLAYSPQPADSHHPTFMWSTALPTHAGLYLRGEVGLRVWATRVVSLGGELWTEGPGGLVLLAGESGWWYGPLPGPPWSPGPGLPASSELEPAEGASDYLSILERSLGAWG